MVLSGFCHDVERICHEYMVRNQHEVAMTLPLRLLEENHPIFSVGGSASVGDASLRV